jgi:hypothetical protein
MAAQPPRWANVLTESGRPGAADDVGKITALLVALEVQHVGLTATFEAIVDSRIPLVSRSFGNYGGQGRERALVDNTGLSLGRLCKDFRVALANRKTHPAISSVAILTLLAHNDIRSANRALLFDYEANVEAAATSTKPPPENKPPPEPAGAASVASPMMLQEAEYRYPVADLFASFLPTEPEGSNMTGNCPVSLQVRPRDAICSPAPCSGAGARTGEWLAYASSFT